MEHMQIPNWTGPGILSKCPPIGMLHSLQMLYGNLILLKGQGILGGNKVMGWCDANQWKVSPHLLMLQNVNFQEEGTSQCLIKIPISTIELTQSFHDIFPSENLIEKWYDP